MKKYIILMLLVAALSNFIYAQKTTFHQNGFERLTKKKHHRRQQITHFEKPNKDRRIASNGTKVKNGSGYKVDKRTFTSVNKLRDNKKFMRESMAMRKQFHGQLRESVYVSNTDNGALRRQLMRSR